MNRTSEPRAGLARLAPPPLEQGICSSGRPVVIDRAAAQSSCRPRPAPPMRGRERLAVVTSYFNPCGYRSLRRNYQRFAQDMQDQRAALFTIELAHRDQAFLLQPSATVVQVRANDVMWQKERLLNVLIQRLPDHFDQVAWVDADVRFENPNWRADASAALDDTPIVQLFAKAALLDREGEVSDLRRGVALLRCYGPAMQEAFLAWAEPLFADVRGRVGCVPGRLTAAASTAGTSSAPGGCCNTASIRAPTSG